MALKLQQGDEGGQQILRVIDASGSMRGVKVTKKDLEQMIENFDNNVLNLKPKELQFNYSHNSWNKAAGWITELRLKGKFLEGKVRWTPKAMEKIEDEEFRFVSAEFAPTWQNVETEEVFQNVLLGAALTNIPFVPGMKPVALSDEGSVVEGIFIFTNNSEMNLFKELLTALQGNVAVSLVEANILQSQFDSLEKELKTDELSASVLAVMTLAKENDAKAVELANTEKAKNEKLASDLAEANVKLAGGADANVELTSVKKDLAVSQTATKALQSTVDKMALAQATKEIELRVDKLCETGRILAKDKQATVDMALSQGSAENQEKFLLFLESQPVKVDFSEIGAAGAEDAGEDAKIANINKLAAAALASDPSQTLAAHITRLTRELE